jgi:hypothetical protein
MDCPRWYSVSKPGEASFPARQYANAMLLAPSPVGSSRLLPEPAETDPLSGMEPMDQSRCGAARADYRLCESLNWTANLGPNTRKMPASPSAILDAQRAHRI